jgi:hypothetical protein
MTHYHAARVLEDALKPRFLGRTILDFEGKPFKVHRIDVENDSPDPGWQVWFRSKDACSTHLPPLQQRWIGLDDALPEVWPQEPTA